MWKTIFAFIGAVVMQFAIMTSATAEQVAVIDAADLQSLSQALPGKVTDHRRDLVGTPISSRNGTHLGIIRGSMVGDDGELYALVAVEEVLDFVDFDEPDAVVRWSEMSLKNQQG